MKNFNLSSTSEGWRDGFEGESSLEFDGSDSKVDVGDKDIYSAMNEFTFAAWIYPKEGNQDGQILYKGGGGNSGEWEFRFDTPGSDFLVEVIENGTSHTTLNANEPPAKEWTHVVGTYNGSMLQLYYNGSLVAEELASHTVVDTDKPVLIGSRPGGVVFNGSLDDVRIYNKALNKEEIRSLYNSENIEENLVGRWGFEAGDGKTAYEMSRYSRNGVLNSKSIKTRGSKDYFRARYGPGRWNFDSITVSTWIYPESLPASSGSHTGGAHIAGRVGGISGQADTSNTDDNWRIAVGNSKIGFYTDSEQNIDHNLYTSQVLKTNKW
ncbi:MAG: LamG domain-containing protein, partial [Candidatus Nanohalobium sp.]